MKQRFIKYLILAAVVLSTAILVVIFNNKRQKNTTFITYPRDYSLVISGDKTHLTVPLLASKKKLECLSLSNIKQTYLQGEYEETYLVTLVDITENSVKRVIDNSTYYQYLLTCELNFSSDTPLFIKHAYLELIFKNNDNISFNIGNISLIKNNFNHYLDIKMIKGWANNWGEMSTLQGVLLEIGNSTSQDITLKAISLLSQSIKPGVIVTYQTAPDSLPKLFNGDWSSSSDALMKEVTIKAGTSLFFSIPIYYHEKIFVNQAGIIISGQIGNQTFEQLIMPYELFTTSSSPSGIKEQYEVY